MNILCVSDGSDRAYEAAKAIAKFMDPRAVNQLTIVLATWPERGGPLWDKARDLWVAEDDLHEAMEIAVKRELGRFRSAFQSHAASTKTASVSGDPVEMVLENARLINADLILLAIAGDDAVQDTRQASSAIIARSQTPVVVAYGAHG